MPPDEQNIIEGDPIVTDPNPESKTESPKPENTVSTVKIGDKEYTVTPEMKAAIEAQQAQAAQNASQVEGLQGQVTTLTNTLQQISTTPPQNTPTEPEEELDPLDPGYTKRLTQKFQKMVEDATTKTAENLMQQYNADKNLTQFWNEFYQKHDDLDRTKHDFLVNAVLQQNRSTIGAMSPELASEELANRVRKQLTGLITKPENKNKVVVEDPSNNTSTPEPTTKDKPKVVSLSDQVNQRMKARMTSKVAKS